MSRMEPLGECSLENILTRNQESTKIALPLRSPSLTWKRGCNRYILASVNPGNQPRVGSPFQASHSPTLPSLRLSEALPSPCSQRPSHLLSSLPARMPLPSPPCLANSSHHSKLPSSPRMHLLVPPLQGKPPPPPLSVSLTPDLSSVLYCFLPCSRATTQPLS